MDLGARARPLGQMPIWSLPVGVTPSCCRQDQFLYSSHGTRTASDPGHDSLCMERTSGLLPMKWTSAPSSVAVSSSDPPFEPTICGN
jgi:hypothetical protein